MMDVYASVVAFNVLCSLTLGTSISFIFIAYFSKQVKRLPTWYMIMSTGALYSASVLLLAGQQMNEEEPGYGLCLAQASLIYALPVGFTTAGASFAVQLHLTLKHFILNQKTRLHRNSVLLLLIAPVFISVMTIFVVVLGLHNPEEVTRSDSLMFCRISDDVVSRTAGVLSGFAGLALLVSQGFTIALLWPRWKSAATTQLPARSGNLISRTTVLRLVVLDVMALSALLIGIAKGTQHFQASAIMNIYIAALTFIGTMTFGVSTLPFKKKAASSGPSDVASISSLSSTDTDSEKTMKPPATFPMAVHVHLHSSTFSSPV